MTMAKATRTRKKKTEKTTEYNVIPVPMLSCRVVVIEVVVYPDSPGIDDALDDILAHIRGYGVGEVVKIFYVSTDFDETSNILARRARIAPIA
jgi:hypothetical protein